MKIKYLLLTVATFLLIGKIFASNMTLDLNSKVTMTSDLNSKATQPKTTAAWTILVYIAADNSLAPFATYNINDMSAGLASAEKTNVLVQWDQPSNKSTWRYKITPGGKIDAGTLNTEMGYNPAQELVSSMQWAKTNFPAQNYALILWDHGSGIEDFSAGTTKNPNVSIKKNSWLKLSPILEDRGILYDDSQKTCLTNQGLTTSLTQIKKILGKNLDIIGMDACLMAMVEVTYQMKGLVNLFVGSEQTIPGNGYPYSKFINPLSLNPLTTSPLQLALSMVAAYKEYYTLQEPTPDFTLSAIDVTSIQSIKQSLENFITAITTCSKIDAKTTKNIIVSALKATPHFEMAEYIDLYSFYANILNQIKTASPKSQLILDHKNQKPTAKPNQTYLNALSVLNKVLQDGLSKITKTVLLSSSGQVYAAVKGISIYYPQTGSIDKSYLSTLFAKDLPAWISFINTYR
jgi:hypothetical protein